MSQPAPLEDYALVGDLQSAALIDRHGSVAWLCLPRFDSPACFAALLGGSEAGCWQLGPASGASVTRRRYRADSLVLESEWVTPDGVVRVVDFMPPRGERADLVRIVEGISGRVEMRMSLKLRFDYGHVVPWIRGHGDDVVAIAGPDSIYLRSPVECTGDHRERRATFAVSAGEHIPFVLTHNPSHLSAPKRTEAGPALEATVEFWRDWLGRCRYQGPWADEVRRSLMLLKALTYQPTGGIVAAVTSSLPEQIGGSCNWDYRYCWLRDATFTLQALLGTGFDDEARAWREWLVRAVAGDPASLQIMYAVDGARRIPEVELSWLSGYRGSTPVRIGNAAAGQLQLDVYGEVLDGLHLTRAAGLPSEATAWDIQLGLLDFLEGNWQEPDCSLWEFRCGQRQFVHSKVMAWAGVDRAIRTVEHHDLDGPVDRWRRLRQDIHDDVCRKGYDPELGSFTQAYGAKAVDAALLLLPRVGFLPWDDPRIRSTVDVVRRELDHDGLLLRYTDCTDLSGPACNTNAFIACSFWLADALDATGRRSDAIALYERLLSLRNDVGMLSEEYDTERGRQVGNTPQAFSLVGLINSARGLAGSHTTTSATGEDQQFSV